MSYTPEGIGFNLRSFLEPLLNKKHLYVPIQIEQRVANMHLMTPWIASYRDYSNKAERFMTLEVVKPEQGSWLLAFHSLYGTLLGAYCHVPLLRTFYSHILAEKEFHIC